MSGSVSLVGAAILGLLLAGYVAQKYLPAPVPRIGGIDLGTTFSSIGVYHAVTGEAEVILDRNGKPSIPSVVAFTSNGTVLVGYEAIAQAEKNPLRTIYDSKRFIGKIFTNETFLEEAQRYPFKMTLTPTGEARFLVQFNDKEHLYSPEQIGSFIIAYLRNAAEKSLDVVINKAVISVPAEFDAQQRNATKLAAKLAGIEVLRVINEPTAAALAYGLHKKEGVDFVLVVDLGGGTLDVSLLLIQGGMFITTAMAGNNHLGGQDFNERFQAKLMDEIESTYHQRLTDQEDLQNLRMSIETAKLNLTYSDETTLNITLRSITQTSGSAESRPKFRPSDNPEGANIEIDSSDSHSSQPGAAKPVNFSRIITRAEFDDWNEELFAKVLKPIRASLEDADLPKSEIDEIVLVGGSTKIPKVRAVIKDYFGGKALNTEVNPDLAVVTGVAVQAGVLGGGWPLQVSAVELPVKLKKIHVYD